jgi:hypothetical protein
MFKDLTSWHEFPHKGQGGAGIQDSAEIHTMARFSESEFQKGKIWWALLDFSVARHGCVYCT